MKPLYKNILWGVGSVLLIVAIGFSSVVPLLIVPIGLIVAGVAVLMVRNNLMDKKKTQETIPAEVAEDLETAQSLYEKEVEENGQANPHAILWEVYKRRADRNKAAKSGTRIPVVYAEPREQRTELSHDIVATDGADQTSDTRVERNHRKRLFRRGSS